MESAISFFLLVMLIDVIVLSVLHYKRDADDRENYLSTIQTISDEAKDYLADMHEQHRKMERFFQDSVAHNTAALKSIQDALKQSSGDPAKTEELLQRVDILISEIEGENEADAKTQKTFGDGLQNLMNYDMGTARAANKE